MPVKYRTGKTEKSSGRRGRGRPAGKSASDPIRETRESATAVPCPIQLPLDRTELIQMAQDSLHTFAVELGLKIAGHLLEDEATRLCGARYDRNAAREFTRYGHQQGVVTLAGQKLPVVNRPRVRKARGGAEASLETYQLLQSEEAMPKSALRRMVNGVSCRNYETVVDVAREGFGVRKSSVSRGFVRASAESVRQLAERRFEGVRFAAIMVDGLEYADEMMIVALGISEKGEKLVLGMRQGATENAEVVYSLLEELRDRGIATSQPTLFVIDGAKALAAGVKRVWGKKAHIQRCQIHKRRNVMAHVPDEHQDEISRNLDEAWAQKDANTALAQLKRLVKRLRQISPDAASSLEEGLEETITILRLRLPEALRRTLKSTNPIESAFHIVRTLTGRVKRWRSGDMKARWCAAGLLRAEQKFRRIKGYRLIPQLIAALDAQHLDNKAQSA